MPVKYSGDYRLAREIFEKVLREITGGFCEEAKESWTDLIHQYRVDPTEIDPRVFWIANDNWMEFTLRYIVDYKKLRITKDRLFTRILEEVDQTNDRVALAFATFHLVETPEIKDRLVKPIPVALLNRNRTHKRPRRTASVELHPLLSCSILS